MEECWLKDNCKQLHCADGENCLIRIKLNYLYSEANIAERFRKKTTLYYDSDGTDKNEFMFLHDIDTNIEQFVKDGRQLYLHSTQAGCGKAQPDDSLILTETGYVKMSDIAIGDTLFGDDGELHHVIGKFDRGYKSVYKITFNDNTSVESCDEHLWNISDRCAQGKPFKTIELKELLTKDLHLRRGTGWRYQIPITAPLNFPSKNFILHPYILGYILGDGCTNKNSSIGLTIQDADAVEIIPYMNSLLPNSYFVKSANNPRVPYSYCITASNLSLQENSGSVNKNVNILKRELKKYNIIDNKAADKCIPDDYLYSDYSSRLSLLQGLMDTDGTVMKNTNNFSFGTVSKKLADQVAFLVQSLGGTVTISSRSTRSYHYKWKDIDEYRPVKDFYDCRIKLPSRVIPFKLSRKIKNCANKQQNEPYRAIHKIEYVGQKHCYCIMTDNPTHLYLTDNCIVTHNTSWSYKFAQSYLNKIWFSSPMKCRVLFIHVPTFLTQLKMSISQKVDYIDHIRENINDCDLVIWDDIGTKGATEYEAEQLLVFIENRLLNQKANIFTANLNNQELQQVLGDRLASRICNLDYNIELHGSDKRNFTFKKEN